MQEGFYWLNKYNYCVSCFQEIHIKQSDNKYIKNYKIGCEFVSLAKAKAREIVIYAKQELQPKKIFEDSEGRYLVVGILLEGKRKSLKEILLEGKRKFLRTVWCIFFSLFFKKLKLKLEHENYEKIIMMGDFNGVNNIPLDNSPMRKGGKLPKIFTEMMEQENLEDIWRKWNSQQQKITYYSARKKAFSRIDMIWVSKNLEVLTSKIEILPKSISNYNPVLWAVRPKKKKKMPW